jgi:Ni/Fe-hydrogenase subunit HybB-like protein
MTTRAVAVGGPIVTRPFKILGLLAALGGVLILWRLIVGLGPTTGLNDGYPWGIWIAWEVVTGTALACGGYAVAILVYVLNQGHFHHLIRPAILTSALGYSMAGMAIAIDVGRYWNLYKVPFSWWLWNFDSTLLEVALCVMAYVVVLWIELFPIQLEKWLYGPSRALRRIAVLVGPKIDRALLWIVALGILLPTMHQSSLGSLYLIATTRLHQLWHTSLLPLLFLVSCIGMGFAAVVFEAVLSSVVFNRRRENRMLGELSKTMIPILLAFLVIRLLDLLIKGRIGLITALDRYSILFMFEGVLFLVPILMLLSRRQRYQLGHLFRAAILIMLAGVLYRFDVYLIAYNPGTGWAYFPSLPEMMITIGILALEIMGYVVIVKRYPILGGSVTVQQK